VTGVPNSGKSEWLDALLTNLATARHWAFALCSLEKRPRDHAKQLLEKRVGKPFFQYVSEDRQRMSLEELQGGLEWVQDHFTVIQPPDDLPPTVDWVLHVARMAVMRHGIRGLVVDPYNELDHQRPPFMSETEYVGHMLAKVKRFAQMYGVHVWFVAHPRQLHNWSGQPPTLYDISGSANFVNKADNGIVVHRVWDIDKSQLHSGGGDGGGGHVRGSQRTQPVATGDVQILVRKVRNKVAGMVGSATLVYDRPTGRYRNASEPLDVPAEDGELPRRRAAAVPATVAANATTGDGWSRVRVARGIPSEGEEAPRSGSDGGYTYAEDPPPGGHDALPGYDVDSGNYDHGHDVNPASFYDARGHGLRDFPPGGASDYGQGDAHDAYEDGAGGWLQAGDSQEGAELRAPWPEQSCYVPDADMLRRMSGQRPHLQPGEETAQSLMQGAEVVDFDDPLGDYHNSN